MDWEPESTQKNGFSSLPEEIVLNILKFYDPTDPTEVQSLLSCRAVCHRMYRLVNTVDHRKLALAFGTSHASFKSRMKTILSTDPSTPISSEFLSLFSILSLDAQTIDKKLPLEQKRGYRKSDLPSPVELSTPEMLDFLQILSAFIRKMGPQMKAIELHSNYNESPPYHGQNFSDTFFRLVSVVLLYGSMHGYLDGVKRLKMATLCESHCCYYFLGRGTCVYDPELEAMTGWTDPVEVELDGEIWAFDLLPRYVTTGRARSSRRRGLAFRGPWETWSGERIKMPLIAQLEFLDMPEDIYHQGLSKLPILEGIQVRLFEAGRDTIWPGADPTINPKDLSNVTHGSASYYSPANQATVKLKMNIH